MAFALWIVYSILQSGLIAWVLYRHPDLGVWLAFEMVLSIPIAFVVIGYIDSRRQGFFR